MQTPINNNIILPPRLFAPAGYYALISAANKAVIDTSMPFDKRQKAVHRYEIADTRGRLALTVPITKAHDLGRRPLWSDTIVSSHGEWWKLHITALESAYGRTPYFEFIIDKFNEIFVNPDKFPRNVIELIELADTKIREILQIETPVEWGTSQNSAIDLRNTSFETPQMPEHYQIRADRLGFIPSLSILDLIFNLGPESVLYIDNLATKFANAN